MFFPVDIAGKPSFKDDYQPGLKGHHGIDVFAPRGTLVYAVADGEATNLVGGLGGNTVYLTATDGAEYYYAHLDSVEGTFPRAVTEGEPIGRVGTTGNAKGTSPHLHFQMRLPGKGLVNPFPYLDNPSGGKSSSAPTSATPSSSAPSIFGDRWEVPVLLAGLIALYLYMKD